MHESTLRELGLTDNEVRIYLLLLKSGTMGPAAIASTLGLHRGYAYDALDRMQEKEVVNTVLKNGKKHFQATSPKNVEELLKYRLEQFQTAIPDLLSIMNTQRESTHVEVHKGQKAYRTLLKDVLSTLKPGETTQLIGPHDALYPELEPIYLEQYFARIRENNITEHVLAARSAARPKYPTTVYKVLPDECIGKVAQFIYREKVAFFLIGTPYFLIVIKDAEIAETYRRQFYVLWDAAK